LGIADEPNTLRTLCSLSQHSLAMELAGNY